VAADARLTGRDFCFVPPALVDDPGPHWIKDSRLWRVRLQRMNKDVLRMGSAALAILILLIASVLVVRGVSLWLTQARLDHGVPVPLPIALISILLTIAGACSFAAYRLIRYALTGSESSASYPL
jgi:hypothetical protein